MIQHGVAGWVKILYVNIFLAAALAVGPVLQLPCCSSKQGELSETFYSTCRPTLYMMLDGVGLMTQWNGYRSWSDLPLLPHPSQRYIAQSLAGPNPSYNRCMPRAHRHTGGLRTRTSEARLPALNFSYFHFITPSIIPVASQPFKRFTL